MFGKNNNDVMNLNFETLLSNQLALSENQKLILNNQVALDKKLDMINKKLDKLLESD
ncbi:hypothetical protein [Methanobrevibacter millerae]|uniref:hypothetical protein n=1 Tax=Methanobrevibacter millerae TaxID=230361 RepID=UPI0026EB1AF6|nr:hypothetical protein [Methanobrevibacter millerae]